MISTEVLHNAMHLPHHLLHCGDPASVPGFAPFNAHIVRDLGPAQLSPSLFNFIFGIFSHAYFELSHFS